MGKLIVIAGLPASGKSTLIKRLVNQFDILTVPEHNEWVKGKFPKAPTNIREKKEKQRFFLNIDLERYKWAKEHLNDADFIISDTDFTSPLAHNYAERRILPELNIYDWMVDEYIKQIKSGNLGIADYYIYLDVSISKRIIHRENNFLSTGRKRNDIFFTEPFPTYMRQFYFNIMNDESKHKALPAIWYENIKNEDDAENDLREIINSILPQNKKNYETIFCKELRNSINDT